MFREVYLKEVQQGQNKLSKFWSCVLFVSIFLFSIPLLTQAQDPGIPDTVRIEADSLIVGQSRPLRLTVVNDDVIVHLTIPLVFSEASLGFALFDSVVYVNRMGDPSVLNTRITYKREINGISPDSLQIGAFKITGNTLPPGSSVVALIYMTGLSPGTMSVDSGTLGPTSLAIIIQGTEPFEYFLVTPEFSVQPIIVVEGTALPELSVSEQLVRDLAGNEVSLNVEIQSPEGFPVTASIEFFTRYDDKTIAPTNVPTFYYTGTGGLYRFEWNSTVDDIGIWRAVFSGCDSLGICVETEAIIQIVQNSSFLTSFGMSESSFNDFPIGIRHGNFDSNPEPEIAIAGLGILGSNSFSVLEFNGDGQFNQVYSHNNPDFPRRGIEVGYFNDDANLDIIQFHNPSSGRAILVYQGDGQNSFSIPVSSAISVDKAQVATLGNYNGDEYLDYALGGSPYVSIFAGSATSEFSSLSQFDASDSVVTMNTADFNNDGKDDLAIGTMQGVKIYLGDGSGNFSLQASYSQMFGSVSIEVTNQGSDFNGDGIYDLCIATPSVGDTSSELVVYLGYGDGTFEQRIVRTVLGQIVANMPADFNGDGLLDIAYLNSAHKYLALIYGDGDGNFTNELRFDVSKYDPSRLICTDFDLDGDIDVAVISYTITQGSSIFYYENQSNPSGFSSTSITIQGEDNAQLELTSPTNKVLNRVSSTIPTGSYYRRNINQNSILDDYASMSVAENGNYILSVKPEPTQPANTPFTVEFTVDGRLYRLAKDATMSETGYNFNINFGNGSGYAPKSGSFIYVNPPAFIWLNQSEVDFQLAADLDFNSIIIDTTIATLSYQPADALSISDTTTFYWRIRPAGETEFGAMNAFNLIPSGPGCGDFDGLAGPLNVLDLTYLVDYMFRGGAVPPDMNLADLTNDGNVGILDLMFLVDFLYRGGLPPPC
ncbi:MAG: VCBS repeat-containing protein [candidate division Zixibacteria bacterium]|nr:VCBS repeat-containing protein [candidate division Zixibacteria bacterium]